MASTLVNGGVFGHLNGLGRSSMGSRTASIPALPADGGRMWSNRSRSSIWNGLQEDIRSSQKDGTSTTSSASPSKFNGTANSHDVERHNIVGGPDLTARTSPTVSSSTNGSAHVVAEGPRSAPSPTRPRLHTAAATNASAVSGTLTSAALLSGSAPDIEPLSRHSYATRRKTDSANRFREFDVADIQEFTPARTPNPYRPQFTFAFTPGASARRNQEPSETARSPTSVRASDIKEYPTMHAVNSSTTRLGEQWLPTADPDHVKYPTRPAFGENQALIGLKHLSMQEEASHFFEGIRSSTQSNGLAFTLGDEIAKYEEFGANHRRDFSPLDFGLAEALDHNTYAGNQSRGRSSLHNGGQPEWCAASYASSTVPESRRSTSGSDPSTQPSSAGVEPMFRNFPDEICRAAGAYLPPHPYTAEIPYGYFATPPTHLSYSGGFSSASSGDPVIAVTSSTPNKRGDDKKHMSHLLREFSSNYKTKKYELKDIYHHIVEFSGDQNGSRFVQHRLETANSDEKEQVFAEIYPEALQLMVDVFGNYVIQKVFEHGNQAQKRMLAESMRGQVLSLSTQMYGCRVVQKALEHVLTDQQATLMKELDGHVLDVIENQNGNHVIQKAVERVPGEHIPFIFGAHRGQVMRLAKHNYGCRVIQRMLEHGAPHVKASVLAELHDNFALLITDQFGNYVMQHVIENGEPGDRRAVVSVVLGQLLYFSKHKFASNVVEKALDHADDFQRQEIFRVLTSRDDTGQSPVCGLIRDQYGNYVIQKVLSRLQGAALDNLVHEVKNHLVTLRRFSHGKQVSAMEKAIAEAEATLTMRRSRHQALSSGTDGLPSCFLPAGRAYEGRFPPAFVLGGMAQPTGRVSFV